MTTDPRLRRTRLWALFDRVALALCAGAVTSALVMCPPQIGKTKYWSQSFPAWWVGHRPDDRVVLGSHGAQYAAVQGRAVRDVMIRHGKTLFGGLQVRDDVSAANEWGIKGHRGGMVTAGVEGGVAGRSAELAIADDIIADAAAAESKHVKDRIWGWWEEELSARLQHGGRRVMIMTRRAVDDPPGRILELIEAGKEKRAVLNLPAVAEADENWPEWNWTRKAGEALVPELHSAEEYEQIRLARDPHVWAGLYQQRPYPRGGGDFKSEWFRIVDAEPAGISSWVRAWDLAASESPTAKRTAGVKVGKYRDGISNRYHIGDIRYGRWNPGRRNQIILETAKQDGRGVPVVIEREGGSGGMAQGDEIVRLLDGWHVVLVPATGSKELRAGPMAGQASVGNFTIRKAPWNSEFGSELDSFPGGPTIDMVDAAAHGYNRLAGSDQTITVTPKMSVPGRQMFGNQGGGSLFS